MIEQKRFRASGTLGDTYIIACKLMAMDDGLITIEHKTKCDYWQSKIRELYDMVPNARVEFVNEENLELERISEGIHEAPLEIELFPEWDLPTRFSFDMEYAVVQAHAGKPLDVHHKFGGLSNAKWLSKSFIELMIAENDVPIVLLAEEEFYGQIRGCINLTGMTSIYDALHLISQSQYFVGFEGMLGFMALSQSVRSVLHYLDKQAIQHRILGSPWDEYVDEFVQLTDRCVTP